MSLETDLAFMDQALKLAARGCYSTAPNPMVGCVVVANGEVIGQGWHQRTGEAHAEPIALEAAGERARGATLYVNLEPCTHEGRTPPCVPTIIESGITRVVFACHDPFERIDGAGQELLEEAGIECTAGVREPEARVLNRGFFKRFTSHHPWVCIKQGMSLDGHTALADGSSQWITSELSRQDVQEHRARSGAVLSTARTVIHDRARLNVRLSALDLGVEKVRQPTRVILDHRGELTADLPLWKIDSPVLVYTLDKHVEGLEEWMPEHGRVRPVREALDQRLDLDEVLADLACCQEINDLWVEAGPGLAGALVSEGLVDELVVYIAPKLIGTGGAPLLELPPVAALDKQPDWRLIDVHAIGSDIRTRYRRIARGG